MAASFAKPRFMLEAGSLAAADVGTATHLVLQHLDFRRPCDRADVAAQLADLVGRKLLAPSQAKCVDADAIAWALASDAGRLLRAHADALLRELPVYHAERPIDSAEAEDQVMVRGRIDVLIPNAAGDGGGPVVVDYKTDRVAYDDAPARAQAYAGQVAGYRRAVEAITGRPVPRVLLVFLHARRVVAV